MPADSVSCAVCKMQWVSTYVRPIALAQYVCYSDHPNVEPLAGKSKARL